MASALSGAISVLILGGTTHLSRPLLKWLLDPAQDAARSSVEIKHIRLADKFLISNGTSTTYIEPDTWEALKDPRVEYRQVNLNLAPSLSKVYDHPDGDSYDVVFDFTGEGVGQADVPEELLIERTAKLAHSIAAESLRRNVKAHIRDTVAFLTIDPSSPPATEADVVKPKTPRAYWWYEAERAAASVPGLPLAITRSAEVVGPYVFHASIPSRYALGRVYAHLNETYKLLWGPDLRVHTIHVDDWCPAAWKLVEFISSRSRAEADEQAGEALPPVRMKDKLQDSLRENVGEECCPRTLTPRAPVFNLVDDTDLTQGKLLRMIGEAFGIQTGFTNAVINAWARVDLASIVDDINEKHANAVAEIVQQTGIEDVALKGWIDTEMLANRSLALSNAKAKRVLQWQPKVQVNRQRLDEILDRIRELNQFPK
ncbi:NAD-P-binding protein [Moesziomyces antarcticus]|uniref:Uncharacterized protein n=1 Tax=Pseudozyma antarctica TaxID=84753 RepID=A0A5C3FGV7_PSEA2|nr:NAD-P-binding protein [Moesziomyces antarcticus]GAK63076.1 NAD-P-binding protein [Moesziomyces antarcticus]SPO43440.1 uncharacterized protein PSANT_01125 [Moesziomyces antarcticus]